MRAFTGQHNLPLLLSVLFCRWRGRKLDNISEPHKLTGLIWSISRQNCEFLFQYSFRSIQAQHVSCLTKRGSYHGTILHLFQTLIIVFLSNISV